MCACVRERERDGNLLGQCKHTLLDELLGKKEKKEIVPEFFFVGTKR